MNGFISILLTIIVFLGVLVLLYVLLYNNLQAYKIKINEAESIIDELLRKKYDLLSSLIKIIDEKTDIENKVFDNINKLKDQNISSFDFERKLTEFNQLMDQIKQDYQSLEEDDAYNNIYEDIHNLNERLEATKNFYNKYTSILNKLVKKFPSNIIAKIHHIAIHTYFDGKNMFDEEINDFKL